MYVFTHTWNLFVPEKPSLKPHAEIPITKTFGSNQNVAIGHELCVVPVAIKFEGQTSRSILIGWWFASTKQHSLAAATPGTARKFAKAEKAKKYGPRTMVPLCFL